MDWKEKARSFGEKTKELSANAREYRRKDKKELKLKLSYKTFGQIKTNIIRKDTNGNYYISRTYNEDLPRYALEHIEFEGSTITQETLTKGSTKEKGRSGSALLGGALLGPVGALAGASRGRKGKTNAKSITKKNEKPGKGKIYLRETETNNLKEIKFEATESEISNIERFFK